MREVLTEGMIDDVKKLLKGFFKKKNEASKSNSGKPKKKKQKTSSSDKEKSDKKTSKKSTTLASKNEKDRPKFRSKKLRGGGRIYYNYDDYQRKNTKLSKGDAAQIANKIDVDRTNIADLARKVLPGHTNNGGQSQLRKIIRGERPMTDKIAQKINSEIATGGVAVK